MSCFLASDTWVVSCLLIPTIPWGWGLKPQAVISVGKMPAGSPCRKFLLRPFHFMLSTPSAHLHLPFSVTFYLAQRLKRLPAMQESWVRSLDREHPLEKEMATHSCLENPMDRGAWWAIVHGVAKSQTRLSDFTFTFYFKQLLLEQAEVWSVT